MKYFMSEGEIKGIEGIVRKYVEAYGQFPFRAELHVATEALRRLAIRARSFKDALQQVAD